LQSPTAAGWIELQVGSRGRRPNRARAKPRGDNEEDKER